MGTLHRTQVAPSSMLASSVLATISQYQRYPCRLSHGFAAEGWRWLPQRKVLWHLSVRWPTEHRRKLEKVVAAKKCVYFVYRKPMQHHKTWIRYLSCLHCFHLITTFTEYFVCQVPMLQSSSPSFLRLRCLSSHQTSLSCRVAWVGGGACGF